MIKISHKTIIGLFLIVFSFTGGLRGYQLSTVLTFSDIHKQIDENSTDFSSEEFGDEMKAMILKAKEGLKKTNFLTNYSKNWIRIFSYINYFVSFCLLAAGLLFLLPHALARIAAYIALGLSIIINFSLPLILVQDPEYSEQVLAIQQGNLNFFGLFLDVVLLVAIFLIMNKKIVEESNNSV